METADWVAAVERPGNALDFDGVDEYVEIAGYKGVGGDFELTSVDGVEELVVGAMTSYPAGEKTEWAELVVDTVTATITDNDCLVGRDTVDNDSDYDDDCDVDLTDFAVFADQFMDCLKPGGGLCY